MLTAFSKTDGYSETYTYDKAGNMLEKNANGVSVKMEYNGANQMTAMSSIKGRASYSYDKNGNLTGKEYNGKRDSYTYNALNQLVAYNGYDGYAAKYTYNANGNISTKETSGNSNRLTIEELIEGKEQTEREGDDEPEPPSITSYVYDITAPYAQVLQEKNGEKVTSYTYGLERISATTGDNNRTAYVYDGRGSVAQEVTYNNRWYTLGGVTAKAETKSKAYTPFGEQIGAKQSGFGFNGEYYDAATGMINLRARQYEPAMNRFSQKDILRGSTDDVLSLNRYAYVKNDPINLVDR